MPQMANILANDGVANVTFTGSIPSSGDNSPAKWVALDEGASYALHPTGSMLTRNNQSGSARTANFLQRFPYEHADGTIDNIDVTIKVVIPNRVPDSYVTRAVAMSQDFYADTLIKSALESRSAPT